MNLFLFLSLAVTAAAAITCYHHTDCGECVLQAGCSYGITMRDEGVCVTKKESKDLDKFKISATSKSQCLAVEYTFKGESINYN